jgi:hypothetical protein
MRLLAKPLTKVCNKFTNLSNEPLTCHLLQCRDFGTFTFLKATSGEGIAG